MARLFFPTSRDTVTCKRCGNDIPGDADNCPQCGADHGPSFGAAQTVAQNVALSTGLRLPFSARREALNIPSPYPGMSDAADASEPAGTGEPRWDTSKIVTLGALAVALVAGGIIYSQHGGSADDMPRSEPPAKHSAYGAIDMKPAQATPAPAVTPAPADDLARSAAAVRQAQMAAAPSVAARETLPTEPAGRSRAALANPADNLLLATRDAIARGDLTTARKRFSKIPASQLGSANSQRTLADLTGLEHTRDEMLQVARGCEATGSWLCVLQNARDVLAIDAGNVEAQKFVEHAISRSGWLNKPAPAATAAHATPHDKTQTAAVAPAAPAPVVAPVPRVAATRSTASTHRSTAAVLAAEHARAVAAMGVPTPVRTPVPVAPVAPAAPVVATTMRTPAPSQTAPEPARIGTGSQAQLTSSPYPPPPQQAAPPPRAPAPAFVPMPDGPDAMPATAPVRSAAAAAQVPGDTASPPVVTRPLAPVSEAVPVRAGVVPPRVAANGPPASVQSMTRQPSPTVRRTLASGDNAASAAQPHAPTFNAANPDEEERAILESGWSKKPSSAQRSTPQ